MGKWEAKVCDVGGKKALRPLPYTIYVNCRDKRFSVQAEKIISTPKKKSSE